MSPAVEARSPNHWTTREVPKFCFYSYFVEKGTEALEGFRNVEGVLKLKCSALLYHAVSLRVNTRFGIFAA